MSKAVVEQAVEEIVLDREKIVIFAGKKFTVQEFIENYGLEVEDDASIKVVMDGLEKKGRLHYPEFVDKEKAMFEGVSKDLELQARIAELEEEAEQEEAFRTKRNREGKLMYEEVEIDFPTKTYGLEFLAFARDSLKVQADLYEEADKFVLVVKNVTEADLASIKRKKSIAEAGKKMVNATDKFANAAIGTASFAAEKVVAPTTKATVKTALGVAKSIVKTGTTVGSNLITSTTKSTRQVVTELSRDEDVLKAKKELIDAKDAVYRMFNRKPKVSSDFRIK